MRTHGTLTKWDDDRGFGFILPAQGTHEVFVHASAFPRDGSRPRVGEVLSFEIEAAADGRRRAVSVQRPGAVRRTPHSHAAPRQPAPRRSVRSVRAPLIGLALLLILGSLGYARWQQHHAASANDDVVATSLLQPEARPALATPTTEAFRCDGRTRCPQMHSCAEAKYFIQHCPGTQMDGDHDGVPCESQWCG